MKIILTLAVLGLTALNAWARPNIVLIMADDVGCEPIGAYGGERWKTPHIDALAKSGMRFDYCFAMPVCHPTRTTLLTGKYPFRLKSRWGSFPKSEEKHTLAQVLKRAGYATAVAGKWQLCLMKNDLQQPPEWGSINGACSAGMKVLVFMSRISTRMAGCARTQG